MVCRLMLLNRRNFFVWLPWLQITNKNEYYGSVYGFAKKLPQKETKKLLCILCGC